MLLKEDIRILSDRLILEIVNAMGFKKTSFNAWLFNLFFQKPARELSRIAVTADRMIAVEGFPRAAGWMLTNWCDRVTAYTTGTVPKEGPLLIISNHAGSYDTLVIASQLERMDIQVISSDVPFLKYLPNASKHLIFLSDDIGDRITATRAGIRHLKNGHALLLYGTGLIDPDPQVYSDAMTWIDMWRSSVDVFLRSVPDTQVVITIVSGVVAEKWAHHPITWYKRVDWQKRRLAEFGQMIQQLYHPGSLYVSPHISISSPVDIKKLRQESDSEIVLPAIIRRGKALLQEHRQTLAQKA